jgi:uncharacterized protein YbcI
VRSWTRGLGRGPTRAHAFFRDNILVVVLEDTQTKAERTLVADDRGDAVLDWRRAFQHTIHEELVATVEALTGCRVLALMSDTHIDPDLAAELFVLDQPVRRIPPDTDPAPVDGAA